MLDRLRRLLPAVWLGLLLALGGVAAPALFANLASVDAGRIAGRLFAMEAHGALGVAVLLFILERRRARQGVTEAGRPASPFSAEVLLVLGVLFCTVAGYFALQPMMAQARAGTGRFSFGALHAVSSSFFLLKGLLLLALAWRGAGRR